MANLKMLACPYCGAELKMQIGYNGCDWDTVAGEGSGFGHIISFQCPNDRCAVSIPLVNVKESWDVTLPLPDRRHYHNYNM